MNRTELKNHYFLLRHGNSLANQQGIIVSNPDIGTVRYGLSKLGTNQANIASQYFTVKDKIIIYSSDFKRTKETAEIVQEKTSAKVLVYTELLRERFFGLYDGLDNSQYDEVWEKDKRNEKNTFNSVESPRQVANRTNSLIEQIESEYQSRNILLISHGDSLQILQTVFSGISPAAHRSLNHLQTGEIRKV